METLLRLLFSLVAAAATETVRMAFPPSAGRSAPDYPTQRARNGWINGVAQVWLVAGFGVPLALSPGHAGEPDWLVFGVACGTAVAAPYAWICLVTLSFGLGRYREFWRFHQLHYGMGMEGVVALSLPFAAFGAISAVMLAARGKGPFL